MRVLVECLPPAIDLPKGAVPFLSGHPYTAEELLGNITEAIESDNLATMRGASETLAKHYSNFEPDLVLLPTAFHGRTRQHIVASGEFQDALERRGIGSLTPTVRGDRVRGEASWERALVMVAMHKRQADARYVAWHNLWTTFTMNEHFTGKLYPRRQTIAAYIAGDTKVMEIGDEVAPGWTFHVREVLGTAPAISWTTDAMRFWYEPTEQIESDERPSEIAEDKMRQANFAFINSAAA